MLKIDRTESPLLDGELAMTLTNSAGDEILYWRPADKTWAIEFPDWAIDAALACRAQCDAQGWDLHGINFGRFDTKRGYVAVKRAHSGSGRFFATLHFEIRDGVAQFEHGRYDLNQGDAMRSCIERVERRGPHV